jgi:hypothetical protein
MGNAANRQSQQSHSIHGGMDRGSPQSTLNSPTSGAFHTLQQKETRKHQSTNETKTAHISNSATMKSAWCCPSERHPTPSLLLRRFYSLETHPSGERSKNEFSNTVAMGVAANRQSQQSHSIHGGMDRGSPQSTLRTVQPVSRSTHCNKRNPHSPITNETNTTHMINPASTKSAWCCPSERHPTPSLLLRRFDSLQTHPIGENPNTNSATQLQWATLPTGNRNNRTRYMVVWIAVLHNPL